MPLRRRAFHSHCIEVAPQQFQRGPVQSRPVFKVASLGQPADDHWQVLA
jgi:hypothetical protein